jgi:hypothetical protein
LFHQRRRVSVTALANAGTTSLQYKPAGKTAHSLSYERLEPTARWLIVKCYYRNDVPGAFIQIINTPIWHVDIKLPFEIHYSLFIQPVGSTGPVNCQPAVRRIYVCGPRQIKNTLGPCYLVRIQNYIPYLA